MKIVKQKQGFSLWRGCLPLFLLVASFFVFMAPAKAISPNSDSGYYKVTIPPADFNLIHPIMNASNYSILTKDYRDFRDPGTKIYLLRTQNYLLQKTQTLYLYKDFASVIGNSSSQVKSSIATYKNAWTFIADKYTEAGAATVGTAIMAVVNPAANAAVVPPVDTSLYYPAADELCQSAGSTININNVYNQLWGTEVIAWMANPSASGLIAYPNFARFTSTDIDGMYGSWSFQTDVTAEQIVSDLHSTYGGWIKQPAQLSTIANALKSLFVGNYCAYAYDTAKVAQNFDAAMYLLATTSTAPIGADITSGGAVDGTLLNYTISFDPTTYRIALGSELSDIILKYYDSSLVDNPTPQTARYDIFVNNGTNHYGCSSTVTTSSEVQSITCSVQGTVNLAAGTYDISGQLFNNTSGLAISSITHASLQVVDPDDLVTITSMSASANSVTIGQPVTISATTSADTNRICVFYVSDGAGTYSFKKNVLVQNKSCAFSWNTSGSSAKHHSIFVALQKSGGTLPATISSTTIASQLTPNRTMQINVCASGQCNAIPEISLQLNTYTLVKGGGGSFSITAHITNPTNTEIAGKYCFLYVGDGDGKYWLKNPTSGMTPSNGVCSLGWTPSWANGNDSKIGSHGIRVVLSAGPNLNASLRADATVRICDTGTSAANCASPDQPDNGGNGGTGGGGGGGGGTPKTGYIDPGALTPVDEDGNPLISPTLGSVEGIINTIFGRWFPLAIGLMAFVSIIWAGFQYMMAAGDPKMAEKGKKTLIYTAIGVFVASFAFIIVKLVMIYAAKVTS